ncbi:MAG: class IV adenylate cyclase [Pirellulales bacterium]|nr:class IV adenylate cyclase [Pirellulales bacterium]
MYCNIELKFRAAALDTVRQAVLAAGGQAQGVLRQLDTYFHCRSGRLKLRQTEGRQTQLIWYRRADLVDARRSDYLLVPLADAEGVRDALAHALGIRAVVAKERELYLWGQVRIHLDQVAGLGNFVELEAVLGTGQAESEGRAWLAELAERLGLDACERVAVSYGDLLASRE